VDNALIRKAKCLDAQLGCLTRRGPVGRGLSLCVSCSTPDAAEEAVMRRILVVDDDLHTRLAIRAWLKQCGFRVVIADGGPNGLAALDDATFDLMIVDIFMPNMRGFEPIRIFHARAPTVPLIAISGYAFSGPETDNVACLKMALSLGATRCLHSRRRCSAFASNQRVAVARVLRLRSD
jgi:CheY-like chemotaxis protein